MLMHFCIIYYHCSIVLFSYLLPTCLFNKNPFPSTSLAKFKCNYRLPFKLLGNSLTALMGILGGYNYTADYISINVNVYCYVYIMYHVLCIS